MKERMLVLLKFSLKNAFFDYTIIFLQKPTLLDMRFLVTLLCYSSPVAATLHHLFVGAFKSPYLYTVGFDDENLTLSLLNNVTTEDYHFWITLDVGRKHCCGFNRSTREQGLTQTLTVYSTRRKICTRHQWTHGLAMQLNPLTPSDTKGHWPFKATVCIK